MRKSYNFEITRVEKRNQLVDALERKDVIIELDGELKEGMLKKLEAEAKKATTNRTLAKIYGIGGILSSFVLWPLAIVQGVAFLASTVSVAKSDFKDYSMTNFENDGERCFLLIHRKKFDGRYDTIAGLGNLRFTGDDKCPACEKKISAYSKRLKSGTNPISCPNCGKKVVLYVK